MAEAEGQQPGGADHAVVDLAPRDVSSAVGEMLSDISTDVVETDAPALLAAQVLDDYMLRDYICSRMPVYAAVPEHALVVCGRRVDDGRARYFVHDDQNGPYLLADPLPALSRDSLRYQTGLPIEMGRSEWRNVPPFDRVREFVDGGLTSKDLSGSDRPRPVLSFIFATPHRVQLSPTVARRQAAKLMRQVTQMTSSPSVLRDDHREIVREATAIRSTILMGIDYKLQRRQEAVHRGYQQAAEVIGAIQLAEWVVVVEGTKGPNSTNEVIWELVFDASSSEEAPRLQMARVLSSIVTVFPGGPHPPDIHAPAVEASQLDQSAFLPLVAPFHVGKTAADAFAVREDEVENAELSGPAA
jgi:hypothetical protein